MTFLGGRAPSRDPSWGVTLSRAWQTRLQDAATDPGLEDGLRRGGGASGDRAVGQPEDAAVPRAGDAALIEFAVGERARQVAAAIGQGRKRLPLRRRQLW